MSLSLCCPRFVSRVIHEVVQVDAWERIEATSIELAGVGDAAIPQRPGVDLLLGESVSRQEIHPELEVCHVDQTQSALLGAVGEVAVAAGRVASTAAGPSTAGR
jgi:hypothetical protein